MKPRISVFALGVRDLAASGRFYEQREAAHNPHFSVGPRDADV